MELQISTQHVSSSIYDYVCDLDHKLAPPPKAAQPQNLSLSRRFRERFLHYPQRLIDVGIAVRRGQETGFER